VSGVSSPRWASSPATERQTFRFVTTARLRVARNVRTTPGRLQLAQLVGIGIATVLVLTTSANMARLQRIATRHGGSSASAVVNAQRVKDAAAGMDSFAVKSLVLGQEPFSVPASDRQQQRNEAVAELMKDASGSNTDFEERRQKLAQRILRASATDPARINQQAKVVELQLATFDYLTQLQSAQDRLQADPTSVAATYEGAAVVMDQSIIPMAEDLSSQTLDALDEVGARHNSWAATARLWMLVLGLTLVGVLTWLQFWLFRKTNRLLNPVLVMLSVLSISYLVWGSLAIMQSANRLKDSRATFENLYELRAARSSGYVANALQTRQFLLPQRNAELEQAFKTDAQLMRRGSASIAQAADDFLRSHDELRERLTTDPQGARSLLAADITFAAYLDANQSDIDATKRAFDSKATEARRSLRGSYPISWMYLAAAITLLIVSIRPRLKEYR
jgi:hypothetical protein